MDANAFERLVDQLRTFTPRAEVSLIEVPAPQKLATFSFAFSADVSNGLLADEENEIANGRFVLLHEPGGQATWDGEFRCVTFVSADLDPVMQEDPLLPEVGWSWFLESLERNQCVFNAPSGTARISSLIIIDGAQMKWQRCLQVRVVILQPLKLSYTNFQYV